MERMTPISAGLERTGCIERNVCEPGLNCLIIELESMGGEEVVTDSDMPSLPGCRRGAAVNRVPLQWWLKLHEHGFRSPVQGGSASQRRS